MDEPDQHPLLTLCNQAVHSNKLAVDSPSARNSPRTVPPPPPPPTSSTSLPSSRPSAFSAKATTKRRISDPIQVSTVQLPRLEQASEMLPVAALPVSVSSTLPTASPALASSGAMQAHSFGAKPNVFSARALLPSHSVLMGGVVMASTAGGSSSPSLAGNNSPLLTPTRKRLIKSSSAHTVPSGDEDMSDDSNVDSDGKFSKSRKGEMGDDALMLRRKKHNEVEVRRRKRMNETFTLLRNLSECKSANKISILCAAIEKIQYLHELIAQGIVPPGPRGNAASASNSPSPASRNSPAPALLASTVSATQSSSGSALATESSSSSSLRKIGTPIAIPSPTVASSPSATGLPQFNQWNAAAAANFLGGFRNLNFPDLDSLNNARLLQTAQALMMPASLSNSASTAARTLLPSSSTSFLPALSVGSPRVGDGGVFATQATAPGTPQGSFLSAAPPPPPPPPPLPLLPAAVSSVSVAMSGSTPSPHSDSTPSATSSPSCVDACGLLVCASQQSTNSSSSTVPTPRVPASDVSVEFESASARCLLCFEHERDTILFPCGHLSFCHKCVSHLGSSLKGCSKCSSPVTKILRLQGSHTPNTVGSLGLGTGKCILCDETVKDVAMNPCGHFLFCTQCTTRAKKCPHCLVSVESRVFIKAPATPAAPSSESVSATTLPPASSPTTVSKMEQ